MAPRAKKKAKSNLTIEERRLLRQLIEGHNSLIDRVNALEDKVGLHKQIGFHKEGRCDCGCDAPGDVPGEVIHQSTDDDISSGERYPRTVKA